VRAALLIAGKDLRQRLRDRSALLLGVVVPFSLAAVFGLTLGDAGGGSLTFDVAVVDRDRGPAARAFAREVLAPLERSNLLELRREESVAAGRRLADGGEVAAAIVLPAGLSEDVAAGRAARIDVIGDPQSPIGVLVARSLAQGYADRVDAVRVAAATAGVTPDVAGRALATPALAVADRTAESRELDATTFYAAGMAVFFLFFAVQLGITSLLDERRDGTLARLLAAPVSASSVLVGKLLTSMAVGVLSMTVLAVATRLLLGARWGDPLGVALLIVAGVLAATAVTALIATLAHTQEQASSWQAIVALVLGMLGGAFFPIAQAGGLVAQLSLLTPHAWFLRGLGEMSGGAGAGGTVGPTVALLVFAAVTGTIALARAERLLRP
jgi:ABC-2 type transport system permease protein